MKRFIYPVLSCLLYLSFSGSVFATEEIQSFLDSGAGKKATDFFKRNVSDKSLVNPSTYVELQAHVSPALRRQINVYLGLRGDDDIKLTKHSQLEEYSEKLLKALTKKELSSPEALDSPKDGELGCLNIFRIDYTHISPFVSQLPIKYAYINCDCLESFPSALFKNPHITSMRLNSFDLNQEGWFDLLLEQTDFLGRVTIFVLGSSGIPARFDELFPLLTSVKELRITHPNTTPKNKQDPCKDIDLNGIDFSKLPETLKILGLVGFGLTEIPSFPSLHNLERLILSCNDVYEWPKTFPGLENLNFNPGARYYKPKVVTETGFS